jgi:thiol-disulfide isomerase/thioredoxin
MRILKNKAFWIGLVTGIGVFGIMYIGFTLYIAHNILPKIEESSKRLKTGWDATSKTKLPLVLESVSSESLMDTINWDDKPYFIHFWATWCKPCIAEMSQVDSLHKSMGDKIDFYILSNEDLKKQKSFLAAKNWDLPFYRYNDSTFTDLNVKVLPTTYVGKNRYMYLQQIGSKHDWNSQKAYEYMEAMRK